MGDEEIRLLLEQVCGDSTLCFQVSRQEPYLYVFINRQSNGSIAYDRLAEILGTKVAELAIPNIQYLALYGRPWGQVEADWQTCLTLEDYFPETMVVEEAEIALERARIAQEMAMAQAGEPSDSRDLAMDGLDEDKTDLVNYRSSYTPPPESDQDWVEASSFSLSGQNDNLKPVKEATSTSPHRAETLADQNSASNLSPETRSSGSPDDPELDSDDFSYYCFIGDRVLLQADLREISPAVAKAIVVFHRFPTRGKHRVLPLLGQIFKGDRGVVFIHFPGPVQLWFETILHLSPADVESAQIWFSRYCHNPSKTLQDIQYLMRVVSEQETIVPSPLSSPSPTSRTTTAQTPSPPITTEPPQTPIPESLTANATSRSPNSQTSNRERGITTKTSGNSTQRTSPYRLHRSQSLPWLWLGALALGASGAGVVANLLFGQGGTPWLWLTLLLALPISTLSTTTSHLALRKLEIGLFIVCCITYALITPTLEGLRAGYGLGWLMGWGIGMILRRQFVNPKQPLPQGLSELLSIFKTQQTTIALALALSAFSLPLLLMD